MRCSCHVFVETRAVCLGEWIYRRKAYVDVLSQAGSLENTHHNMHRICTENGAVKAPEDTQNPSNMDVAMETKTSSEKRKFCIENRRLRAFGLGIAINPIKR